MTQIPAEAQSDVPTVSSFELPDDAPMLDVREYDEWQSGRAPHAMLIPLSELEGRLDELPDVSPLVVACRSGERSSRAVAFLRAKGFDAVNLEGGMVAWQNSNRPMRHDGPGIPEVR